MKRDPSGELYENEIEEKVPFDKLNEYERSYYEEEVPEQSDISISEYCRNRKMSTFRHSIWETEEEYEVFLDSYDP